MPSEDFTKGRFRLILASFIGSKESGYGFLDEGRYAIDVPAEDAETVRVGLLTFIRCFLLWGSHSSLPFQRWWRYLSVHLSWAVFVHDDPCCGAEGSRVLRTKDCKPYGVVINPLHHIWSTSQDRDGNLLARLADVVRVVNRNAYMDVRVTRMPSLLVGWACSSS